MIVLYILKQRIHVKYFSTFNLIFNEIFNVIKKLHLTK